MAAILPGETAVDALPIERGAGSEHLWRIGQVLIAAFVAELAVKKGIASYNFSVSVPIVYTILAIRRRPLLLVSTESSKLFVLKRRWLLSPACVLGEVPPDKVHQVEKTLMRVELSIDGDEYLTTRRAARRLPAMLAPLLGAKFALPGPSVPSPAG